MQVGEAVLLVGLGNPGSEYERTRHNVGFLALDKLNERLSWPWKSERKFRAEIAKGMIQGVSCWLVKPQTFMNLSGESVGALARYLGIQPQHVLVVIDDIALPLGVLRLREGGGSGGHNGLRSIESHLGTQSFPRLKLGVGAPEQKGEGQVARHVLASFRAEERGQLDQMLEAATGLMEAFVAGGWQGASRQLSLQGNRKRTDAADGDAPDAPAAVEE
jgi:PTH1 family peptidyl-tRNA hydrolase